MINDIFPHKVSAIYKPDIHKTPNDLLLCFDERTVLAKTGASDMTFPKRNELNLKIDNTEIYLFDMDDKSCFLVMDLPTTEINNYEYKDISFFRSHPNKEIGWITILGFHLYNWYNSHKYCGKCGSQTKHKSDERALICPHCNSVYFPVISPAIIVAIIAENKILLARNANFSGGWYSLIAGYVDVGETVEQTVVREVKEETGLDVYDIKYYGSQPWALSGSLMLGFVAHADINQEIKVDGEEIVIADWFSADNLPNYPSNASIAGEMIDKFKNGVLPI